MEDGSFAKSDGLRLGPVALEATGDEQRLGRIGIVGRAGGRARRLALGGQQRRHSIGSVRLVLAREADRSVAEHDEVGHVGDLVVVAGERRGDLAL